ncbi:MAG TPA: hypothetical protein VK674_07305 [Candidatus Limnocylindria bacterium]|nr:hypothetical protein [Candidatus Limnocylindria bacterium]
MKNSTLLRVGLAALIVVSNLLFGFPADMLITKWNESKIVDNLYLSLHDSRVVDEGANDAPTVPTLTNKAQAANFSMQSGYYVGTGVAGRTITGLGFQPSTVMIKSSTNAGVMVFKTSAMPANATAFSSAAADNTGTNITFTADGFTVGTLANVNTANALYYWTAFTGSDCSATGNYCVGSYTGNAAATRTITTGFQPSFVMVKRSTAVAGHFRVASQPANETLFLTTAARDTAGNYIRSFAATSFDVGATDNASTGVFYYVAFKATAGGMSQGTYTGNATDNRNITGVGFQASLVMVKNATSATVASRDPVMNRPESYGDSSSFVGAATANLVNAVQALQSDGFQVGTAAQTNETGATFYWVAFGGAAAYSVSGGFQMETGTYTGNGTGQSVAGLGFQPELVIIKDNAANYSVFRTGLMAGNSTAYFSNAAANFTGGITSLDAGGFTVGASTIVNTSANTYQWQAFAGGFDPYTNTGAADFAIGAYYGNGIDSRNITRLPFQPNMVTAKRSGASAGTFRTSAMAGDLSGFFGATAEGANRVQALTTDGYQVGTDATVNAAANLYHWFAFKNGDNFAVGSYSGTGAAQNITTAGFQPDLVWVKRTTNSTGVHRGASLAGNATQHFANTANTTNRITALICNGFSVTTTSAETNVSGSTYRYAAWRSPGTGILGVDIVDSSGCGVSSPGVSMSSSGLSFACTTPTGTLGTSSQKVRVTNTTGSPNWSLTVAATGGDTSLWSTGSVNYDFNDAAGSPAGCSDGVDADSGEAGQLSLNPSTATITPKSGCSATGISLGGLAAFAQGTLNSLTLASASGANTNCYWDIVGVGASQKVPPEQPAGTYNLNLTVTVTAN